MKRGLLVVLVTLFCAASAAEAGIFKCVGADGKTFYTSDASACPGAKPHVLKRKVQNVLDERSSPVLRAGGRPAAPSNRPSAQGDGLEAMWRGKRPAAERELKEAERRVERMRKVMRACNRGGEWYKTGESGIRQHIPCSELRERNAEAVKKRDELVAFLEDGLEDACRRAGCQPGWVR